MSCYFLYKRGLNASLFNCFHHHGNKTKKERKKKKEKKRGSKRIRMLLYIGEDINASLILFNSIKNHLVHQSNSLCNFSLD